MLKKSAAIIGGGPAGLMAAQVLAERGLNVTVCDAMPSLGRKFLMAGKSGLNLTKQEDQRAFCAAYMDAAPWLRPMLAEFGAADVQCWAKDLGQKLFVGSSGRVFPTVMKASPLLRAWLARLDQLGVQLRTRARWTGWAEDCSLSFLGQEGPFHLKPDVTVLALGGASWSRLGSDGAWRDVLSAKGVQTTKFMASNAGVTINWSDFMRPYFGAPLKNVVLQAGRFLSRGEAVITKSGVEGGGLYPVIPGVRAGHTLTIDLFPDLDTGKVTQRLARPRGKTSLSSHLRKTLRLQGANAALFNECARPLPASPPDLARRLKALPLPVKALSSMDRAISTVGGVDLAAIDETLMLRALPGVFCAGEMLDWDAPTGGYLLTACLSTGRWAGCHAADYAETARA